MILQDLAAMITVRNFLANSIDNLNVRLSREEIKSVQQRVQLLDKTILDNALKTDLTRAVVREMHFNSTEDTAETLRKFTTNENSTPNE